MDVDTKGPLFNGEALLLLEGMTADIERVVASTGQAMVLEHLADVLQHPTGFYESHVTTEPGGGDTQITDTGIVYGPWLEGVGSRNFPKTRFRGYATFRRVTQELDERAQGTAERVAAPWIGRMG